MKAPDCFASWALPALFLAIGCGSDQGMIDPGAHPDGAGPSLMADRFSEWSEPINLGSVNSPVTENTPEISKDGLSLYFGSPRAGGSGSNDLWVIHRACTDAGDADCNWQPAVNLGPVVNSSGIEAGPELSRDGHLLFFTSSRPGGEGSNDLYVSRRPCTDATDIRCAWGPPANLGLPINTFEFEGGPTVRGPELYFNRGNVPGAPPILGSPASDIWVSRIENDVYGTPTQVKELSIPHPVVDQRPSIRFDGREIFLSSDRAGGMGSHDLWVSTRQGNGEPWTHPLNLGPRINSEFEENHPSISPDGTMLLFASRRPSPGEDCSLMPMGMCDLDLYITTRRVTGQD